MMFRQGFTLIRQRLILGFFLVMMGCVTLPTQEMSDARQALAAAESVNAGVLAPETYSEAKRMLRSAEKSLRKRNYSLARRDALRAKELAMQARRAALSDEEP